MNDSKTNFKRVREKRFKKRNTERVKQYREKEMNRFTKGNKERVK